MASSESRRCQPKWTLLYYLFYAIFLFVEPAVKHAGWAEWGRTLAVFAIFLVLYVAYVVRPGPLGIWCVAGIAALGFAYWPFAGGAASFFIYAAALLGFVFKPKSAFVALGALLLGMAIESLVLNHEVWFWAPPMLIALAIGAIDIQIGAEKRADAKLRLAHDEIERLAKVAERERIARDLHDVLGHTLSVIVLKSELASRLVEHDQARAKAEMAEVEQIARDALAEVRHAIRGYRTGSLAEEFARARATLETAGIQTQCETDQIRRDGSKLSAAQETVLALVVREAVTNVVRHSGARNCRIIFGQDARSYNLRIEDDGRGGTAEEGNGLRGMRERVEALYGTMTHDGSHGTKLSITLPTRDRQEAIA